MTSATLDQLLCIAVPTAVCWCALFALYRRQHSVGPDRPQEVVRRERFVATHQYSPSALAEIGEPLFDDECNTKYLGYVKSDISEAKK